VPMKDTVTQFFLSLRVFGMVGFCATFPILLTLVFLAERIRASREQGQRVTEDTRHFHAGQQRFQRDLGYERNLGTKANSDAMTVAIGGDR
jgi:hypothetical protein